MLTEIKKFMHRCPKCSKSYTVRIDISNQSLHSANCPHCGQVNYFDNRNGALAGNYASKNEAGYRKGPAFRSALKEPDKKPKSWKYHSSGSSSEKRSFTSSRSVFRISDMIPDFTGFSLQPVIGMGLIGVSIFGLALAVYTVFTIFHTPDFKAFASNMGGIQANRVLDRNGKVIAELFAEKSGTLKPGDIPDKMKEILLFAEDRNFYHHSGIHWPSIFRAFVINIFSFGYSQGGSTITQQLSRILMKDRAKTIFRKIREAKFAGYLEDNFTKEEILTGYMNHVYLGHGAIGMDTAARFYFDKELRELNFTEMLVLSSLPSAPEKYSPVRNPGLIEAKMNHLYSEMKEKNLSVPPEDLYEKQKLAVFQGISRSPSESVFGSRINEAPWVGEYVRIKIKELFGDDFQYGAGLIVETTIDQNLQKRATKYTAERIREDSVHVRPVIYDDDNNIKWDLDVKEKIRKAYFENGLGAVIMGMPQPPIVRVDLQSASIGLDPETGGILFMQGGSRFTSNNQYNRSIQMRRQTGSAIKPVVYAAGIEKGVITAASLVDDTPLFQAEEIKSKKDKGYWLPGNITGVYEGKISVRRAIAFSKNIPAIRVARLTGLKFLSEKFRLFFFHSDEEFDSRFRNDDTIAIGSLEMSPLDMALAFSAFGNNGIIHRPYLITSIKNSEGTVMYSHEGRDEFNLKMPETVEVIPGDVAAVVASLMGDAAQYGGTGIGSPLIGKTGTTNNHKDAWFVGVLPGLSAAVWVGFDDPNYSMPGATGSSVAGPLFGNIASGFSARGSFSYNPEPRKIEVCSESGALVSPYCPRKKTEIFTLSHGPEEICPLHTSPSGDKQWSINSKSDFD